MANRREVNDDTCLFCSENESIAHLFFFCCCVAKQFWSVISEIIGVSVRLDFESMTKW
jgi:hypothetical protein